MNRLCILKPFFLSFFLLLALYSCTTQEDSPNVQNSLVNVKLSATPSAFQSFNLNILEVQLQVREDQTDPNAWITLNTINTGFHDLTQLRSDQVISLVDFEEVPAELIYSIKVVLGENNIAIKNGVSYDLLVASAYENSPTNIIEKKFQENRLYDLTIELNVDESINFSSGNEADLYPKTNTLLRLYHLF